MSNIVFTDAKVAAKYESLTDIDYDVVQARCYAGKLSNITYAAAYKMVKCGCNLLKVKDGYGIAELKPVEEATDITTVDTITPEIAATASAVEPIAPVVEGTAVPSLVVETVPPVVEPVADATDAAATADSTATATKKGK